MANFSVILPITKTMDIAAIVDKKIIFKNHRSDRKHYHQHHKIDLVQISH